MKEQFNEAVEQYELKNYVKAHQLFEEVAVKDSKAMFNLALMYMRGMGCEKNPKKALYWLEKAANEGNVQALSSLASFFERGTYGSVDLDKALKYYVEAANLGDINAQLKAGLLYRQNEDIAKAMQYLITAAHNDNAQAQNIITYVSNSSLSKERNEQFRTLDISKQLSLVENLIDTKIQPMLQVDNGGIKLINYVEGEKIQIWLNYLGACSGCQLGSTSTADMLLDYFEGLIDKSIILYLM